MVRFEVTIGWWEDSNYKEKTERGITCGPTAGEALAQIEEYYGEELQEVKIVYSDDMTDKIYVGEFEDSNWLTKED